MQLTPSASPSIKETSSSSSNYTTLDGLLVAMMTLIFLCLTRLQKTTNSHQSVRRAETRGTALTEDLRDIYQEPRPRAKAKQRNGSVSKSTEKAFRTSLGLDCGTDSPDLRISLEPVPNVELSTKFI